MANIKPYTDEIANAVYGEAVSYTHLDVYKRQVQSSTHIFICDFKSFRNLSKKWVWNPFNLKTGVIQSEQDETKIDATSENARMIIDGVEYHILMIDDPMGCLLYTSKQCVQMSTFLIIQTGRKNSSICIISKHIQSGSAVIS